MPTCPHCQSDNVRNGLTAYRKQNYGAAAVDVILANFSL